MIKRVIRDERGWHFVDETEGLNGPYQSEEEALSRYKLYCTLFIEGGRFVDDDGIAWQHVGEKDWSPSRRGIGASDCDCVGVSVCSSWSAWLCTCNGICNCHWVEERT